MKSPKSNEDVVWLFYRNHAFDEKSGSSHKHETVSIDRNVKKTFEYKQYLDMICSGVSMPCACISYFCGDTIFHSRT